MFNALKHVGRMRDPDDAHAVGKIGTINRIDIFLRNKQSYRLA